VFIVSIRREGGEIMLRMLRKCSYCKQIFGCRSEINPSEARLCSECHEVNCQIKNNDKLEITYGICPYCKTKIDLELREIKRNK